VTKESSDLGALDEKRLECIKDGGAHRREGVAEKRPQPVDDGLWGRHEGSQIGLNWLAMIIEEQLRGAR
jgi:hypothetical protein